MKNHTDTVSPMGVYWGARHLIEKEFGAHGQHGASGVSPGLLFKKRNFIAQTFTSRGAEGVDSNERTLTR